MHKFSFLIFAVLTHLIVSSQEDSVSYFGHRGCRGLYPENTIIGFKKAIALGVDGIEWDVVVNKDKQLVISHDQFFEKEFCLMPDGSEISDEKATNIYQMTQDQIEQYDCGTKVHKRFLEQQKIKETKPLLKTVFDSIDFSKTTILFEIKSESDQIFINGATADDIEIITGITSSNISAQGNVSSTSSVSSQQTITSRTGSY
jgi:glycerophosphoryl diester phosphodiesterase